MRLTMHENTVLNAIASCHPVKSSHAKLVKATGMARNELTEVLTDLSKVGFVSVTDKHEVYLIEDGKVHLGLTERSTSADLVQKPVSFAPTSAQTSAAVTNDAKPHKAFSKMISAAPSDSETTQQEKQAIATDAIVMSELGVMNSIAALGERLARPTININNIEVKTQVLNELSKYLAEDIAELLLEVKADLERISV